MPNIRIPLENTSPNPTIADTPEVQASQVAHAAAYELLRKLDRQRNMFNEERDSDAYRDAGVARDFVARYINDLEKWQNLAFDRNVLPSHAVTFYTAETLFTASGADKVRPKLPRVLQLKKDKVLKVVKYYYNNETSTQGAKDRIREMREVKAAIAKIGYNPSTSAAPLLQDYVKRLRSLRKTFGKTGMYNYTISRAGYSDTVSIPSGSDMADVFRCYKALRRKISHARVKLRRMAFVPGGFGSKAGFVYNEPGRVLYKIKERKKQVVFKDKAPTGFSRHFGIELEFVSKSNAARISDKLFDANLGSYVTLKGDGSLRVSATGDVTHELCILVAEKEMDKIIPKICKILKETGGYVNKTCGMHVHLDMRNRKAEVAYDRLLKSLEIMYLMTPPERRYNRYCVRNAPDMPFTTDTDNRYWAINPSAYRRHQTIEVRLHSGTLNATKILNWAKLLSHIIGIPNAIAYRNPAKFIEAMKLPKDLADYVLARIDTFQQDGMDVDDEHLKVLGESGNVETAPRCDCHECRAAMQSPTGEPEDYDRFTASASLDGDEAESA